jgi:hypothetical protein
MVQRMVEGEKPAEPEDGDEARPMNLATLRDFFVVAPIIYEGVGRLAVQNFKPSQLAELKKWLALARIAERTTPFSPLPPRSRPVMSRASGARPSVLDWSPTTRTAMPACAGTWPPCVATASR